MKNGTDVFITCYGAGVRDQDHQQILQHRRQKRKKTSQTSQKILSTFLLQLHLGLPPPLRDFFFKRAEMPTVTILSQRKLDIKCNRYSDTDLKRKATNMGLLTLPT